MIIQRIIKTSNNIIIMEKYNLSESSKNLWKFLFDFQTGNLSKINIDMKEAWFVSDVLEVCQAITDEKNELIEFLNKS